MPNSTEGSLFSYEDNYLINRSLTFNGAKQDNSKTLEISSQGGNVIFRVANTEVGEYVSNDDAEIAHNGSLITKTDATLEDLKIQISPFLYKIFFGKIMLHSVNYKVVSAYPSL